MGKMPEKMRVEVPGFDYSKYEQEYNEIFLLDDSTKFRHCMEFLKTHFTRWRTPAVELPAESVIEEVVKEIMHIARLGMVKADE